ncbi:hypothetical protein ABIB17_003959 [Arthrobacter sp. UYEF6]
MDHFDRIVTGARLQLMEVPTPSIQETSTYSTLPPDLNTFCPLDELRLKVTGQRLEPDRAVLAVGSSSPRDSIDRRCRRCWLESIARTR